MAEQRSKIRILCLHGFSGNAPVMRFQTGRLRKFWAEHLQREPLVAVSPWMSRCVRSTGGGEIAEGNLLYDTIEFIFLESPRELLPEDEPQAEITALFPGPSAPGSNHTAVLPMGAVSTPEGNSGCWSK